MGDLPPELLRSITWDQGIEMARHPRITADLGAPVYFCDPHAPWQRGTNENTNGLLRQYFPKGTDLSVYSAKHLRAVEDELNNRPRLVLDDRTPAQLFATLLASPDHPRCDADWKPPPRNLCPRRRPGRPGPTCTPSHRAVPRSA